MNHLMKKVRGHVQCSFVVGMSEHSIRLLVSVGCNSIA